MRSFALLMIFPVHGMRDAGRARGKMQREIDDMIAAYGPACEKLGYANGSEGWRQCMLRLNTNQTIARYSTAPTTRHLFRTSRILPLLDLLTR